MRFMDVEASPTGVTLLEIGFTQASDRGAVRDHFGKRVVERHLMVVGEPFGAEVEFEVSLPEYSQGELVQLPPRSLRVAFGFKTPAGKLPFIPRLKRFFARVIQSSSLDAILDTPDYVYALAEFVPGESVFRFRDTTTRFMLDSPMSTEGVFRLAMKADETGAWGFRLNGQDVGGITGQLRAGAVLEPMLCLEVPNVWADRLKLNQIAFWHGAGNEEGYVDFEEVA